MLPATPDLPASAHPTVSVLLPVYNGQRYIEDALLSIRAQTFDDFECLVVDDGSTDFTPELARQQAGIDPRVRIIRLAHGGIVAALNAGLREARGELIARMDADDLCFPQRFQRQVDYLRAHPECVVVGSSVMLIDPYGSALHESVPPTAHEAIEAELLRPNGWAMFHPSTMIRREPMIAAGGYRPEFQWTEDIDLFLRLAEVGRLANLPEVLLQYRQHWDSVNATRRRTQMDMNRRLLEDAYRRRGRELPAGHVPLEYPTLSPFEKARAWGWAALRNRNYFAARRHALTALRNGPLRRDAWTLAYRSVWHG